MRSTDEIIIGEDQAIEWDQEIVKVDGVWDLTMVGSERLDVERRYQILTDGPDVGSASFECQIVSREDGTYCEIREHLINKTGTSENLIKPHHHPDNYFPANGLPTDSILVVRTSALHDLERRVSEPDQQLERPIGQRERRTLLVIVAALAKLAKLDVSKPSSSAAAIESQTALMGARVATRTIENHLKLIPEALERLSK